MSSWASGKNTTDHFASWPLVLLAVGAGVLVAFQVGKVIIALPLIRAEFGLDFGTAGLLVSSYTIVGAFVGLVAGRAIDRIGREKALVFSLLLVAAGSTLGALAPNISLLLASRLLEGLGYVGTVVASPSLITVWGGAGRRLPLALWGLYLPLGQVIMFVVGPAILNMSGWRGLWLDNGALLALFAVVCWFGFTRRSAGGRRNSKAKRGITRALLRHRPILVLSAVFGLYSLQYLSVIGFLPTIYAAGQVGPVRAGVFTGVVAMGSVVGILVSIVLLRARLRAGTLLCLSSLGTAVMAVAIYAGPADNLSFAVTAATAFTVVGGLLPSAVFASIPASVPSAAHIAPANGLVIQASNVGSLIGAPILGALAHATGTWAFSPFVLSPLALLSLGLSLGIRRREGATTAR